MWIITEKYSNYHATCEDRCTWYEFAKEIFNYSNIEIIVNPYFFEQFPQKAKRPSYSALNNKNFRERLECVFPHWKEELDLYLQH